MPHLTSLGRGSLYLRTSNKEDFANSLLDRSLYFFISSGVIQSIYIFKLSKFNTTSKKEIQKHSNLDSRKIFHAIHFQKC